MLRAILLAVFTLTLAVPATASEANYRVKNERAIRHIFGKYGTQAVNVAECESGLSVWAKNGQYLGLFQMGSYARAKYGHGWNPWIQSRAAYRYFRDAGWSPWTCSAWG